MSRRYPRRHETHHGTLAPILTPAQEKARDQAQRDAERFIRLANRIIPRRQGNNHMTYEPKEETGIIEIRNKDTGELITTRVMCGQKTKLGERCHAFALNGTDTCFIHASDETLEALGHSKAQIKKKPRTMLALDALVESEMENIFGVYFDALDARDPISGRPLHDIRMRAATELLDRTQGKATSKQEITGSDGDPITLAALFADNPADVTDTE